MAGQLKTDILAVGAAIADNEEATVLAETPGFSARDSLAALLAKRDDCLRLANEIKDKLPAGTAKTAMDTVIADLA
jgi:hypothetical protein